jgi:diguanylate cyclase (GGDEF)-like protein
VRAYFVNLARAQKGELAKFADTDLAARLGGDEFAVLLRECAVSDAAKIAHRLLDDARVQAKPVSIGIAGYPHHGPSPEELMRAPDGALYRAKQTGKDRLVVAPDRVHETAHGGAIAS